MIHLNHAWIAKRTEWATIHGKEISQVSSQMAKAVRDNRYCGLAGNSCSTRLTHLTQPFRLPPMSHSLSMKHSNKIRKISRNDFMTVPP
ncbi:hypothetical protein CDAR_395921 [Caerostris darwini]|uniref:Uncharacterized protein n=1 Tax=Caerostris darwini TaxID=1538125 RepID=A0AAV4WP24_9ARAC|nr:hypothetical protein CDAR_395921 [Caerostris darwini]